MSHKPAVSLPLVIMPVIGTDAVVVGFLDPTEYSNPLANNIYYCIMIILSQFADCAAFNYIQTSQRW